MKTFFLHRTGRGTAGGGRGDTMKTRLRPIARWMQRRMMWMCGYSSNEMKDFVVENSTYPETDDDREDDIHGTAAGVGDNI